MNNTPIFSDYTALTESACIEKLNTSMQGLTNAQVKNAEKIYGKNSIQEHPITWVTIFIRQFKSFFIWTYACIIGISLLLHQFDSAAIIFLCVAINVLFGFYQEYHATKNLSLLKKYLISRARVRREGQELLIPSNDLVPGDIIIVNPGDRLTADIRFIEQQSIVLDESILTGESAPVRKSAKALTQETTTLFNATNIGFAGTTIVSGHAQGVVIATGASTLLHTLSPNSHEKIKDSSLAAGAKQMSVFILKFNVIALIITFIAHFLIKGSIVNITEFLLFSIALAVSIIPEALPVVITFCLSRGVSQLAKNKVIIKRLSALEDLGSIEVLCTDKTGTLTENQLTIASINNVNDHENTLLYAALAVEDLKHSNSKNGKGFDNLILNSLSQEEQNTEKLYTRHAQLPFDPQRRHNTVLAEYDKKYVLIVRGAPEHIVELSKLDIDTQKSIMSWIQNEGRIGHQIIAIAKKQLALTDTANFIIEKEEHNLEFVGLISFVDPLKKTAIEAILKAKKLGIIIKIMSGDMPEICGAIAKKVGLVTDEKKVLTGQEFDQESDESKEQLASEYMVFARFSPEQKKELISLLNKKYVTGYIGDGINDVPALKEAAVSLVVQDSIDVAQDAADIILLKKSLLTLINGIEEGRKTVVNTLKYVRTTLAANFGNFYALVISSLMIDYLPMLPVQILLVNLITDFPMIAISTDTTEFAEINVPKKFNVRSIFGITILLGFISTIFDFITFSLFRIYTPATLQTAWFIESVLTELVLIFSIRTTRPFFKSFRPSYILLFLSLSLGLITCVMPYTSIGQIVLHFIPLSHTHIMQLMLIVGSYFVTTEIVKNMYYKKKPL